MERGRKKVIKGMMNLEGAEIKTPALDELKAADKWILSRVNTLAKDVTENMDKFEMGIAVQKVYDFIWDEFCDWYIEITKVRTYNKENDPASANAAFWTLKTVLTEALKLLHPFMPFVTEEIWLSFPHKESSIMVSDFPKYKSDYVFEESEKDVEVIISVIKSVRNLRREMNVPQGRKSAIYIETSNLKFSENLLKHKEILCRLCLAKDVTISEKFNLEKYVTAVNDYVKIYLPTEELIDISAEISRLNKELELSKKQLLQAEQRLKNKNFISKAPKEVVDGAKDLYNKLNEKVEKLENTIKKFES